MDFPILIDWTGQFSTLDCLVAAFIYLFSNFEKIIQQVTIEDPDQVPRSVVSGLGLNCLS